MFRLLARNLARLVGYSLLGAVIVVVLGYRYRLDSMPALSAWHSAGLESEFRAPDAARVRTLADYRALEDRLFSELRTQVYDRVAPAERFGRYSRGSIADPFALSPDWNRTFELAAPAPRGGVLLLHGLSDSPYSMRALGERLNARGFHVVGLRLPGHGTHPAGLLDVTWHDFAAAARLAARDLSQRIGAGKPLYMVGYSTGAAIAVEYALSRAQGEDLPAVARMVLLSPAIGVSPAAALAVWQKRIGAALAVEKLAWSDILPEYDPYKYNSFTVNAGQQAHELTRVIAQRLELPAGSSQPPEFPKILAFQSAADATVSAPALIAALFRSLRPGAHELVLFDINRHSDITDFHAPGAPDFRQQLLGGDPLPFDLTLVTNASADSHRLVALHREASTGELREQPTDLIWPSGIFSLTHVALPFPPDDPVYGSDRPPDSHRIFLGRTTLLGERGVLALSPALLMRLRHNPFFDYMAARIDDFLVHE